MSYDEKAGSFDKEHIWVVEMDLDYCVHTQGSGVCTASETGDAKCFNTQETCNLLSVYNSTGTITINANSAGTFTRTTGSFLTDGFAAGQAITASGFTNAGNNSSFVIDSVTATVITVVDATGMVTETGNADEIIAVKGKNTYRFCSNRSPHPKGLDAIPSLKSVSMSAGKIDISGGLGVRSSVNLNFNDHQHSDIGIDKYIGDRTYDPFERGTFWTKLRARNPNYENRILRVYSGFLENDGSYDVTNFKRRDYIIDKVDASDGACKVVGKDPLKLASAKKAQVPSPSKGQLNAAIDNITTSATLKPAGIGNSDYPASGKLVIDKEVMSFTRSGDALTLTRGQNNTVAAAHSIDATVQICYEQTAVNVDVIVYDLLVNYCNIDPIYINQSAWASETSTYLNDNMNGIIVKPTDVNKELKLLAKSAPHYLWWDEENQLIRFDALKAPPPSANVIDEDLILEGTFSTKDEPDMRRSTVFVNYAPFDPTEKIDEDRNYQLSYVRIDTDSISKYGSNQIEKVNTRWIGETGKASAIKIATLIGRRFANAPRMARWSVDPAYYVDLGGSSSLNHRDIADYTGLPVDTIFQLISKKEADNRYDYEGLEFAYGQELADDALTGVDTIYLTLDERNVNLADKYTTQIGAITGDITVLFIVDTNVIIGSTSNSTHAMDLGNWAGATSVDITLELKSNSYVVGYGGNGSSDAGVAGGNGGPAINLTENITLVNNGTIGGGGGGGGADFHSASGSSATAGGGGGAGDGGGVGGTSDFTGSNLNSLVNGGNGSHSSRGSAGRVEWGSETEPDFAQGGLGGDLGAAGANADSAGGSAGKAIDLNTNTITYDVTGNIYGVVS